MRELSPFYIPFIPAKHTSSPLNSLLLLPEKYPYLPRE